MLTRSSSGMQMRIIVHVASSTSMLAILLVI